MIPKWPTYDDKILGVEHCTALSDDSEYYGWPANHGAWQWEDHFLVGFAFGEFDINAGLIHKSLGHKASGPTTKGLYSGSMHKVSGPITKGLLRSYDGGCTWRKEFPCDFEGIGAQKNPHFYNHDEEIYRVGGVFGYGGELCDPVGSVYTSSSQGYAWNGPYTINGFEEIFEDLDVINTSRTCVLGDLVFLSVKSRFAHRFGIDYVICAKIDKRGFIYLSCIKPEDSSRCVMPSAVRDEHDRIFVACRRRSFIESLNWIELYRSDDDGLTWVSVSIIAETGDPNGNPPSLKILDDGRLICAFGNRSDGVMGLAISGDSGMTWKHLLFRERFDAFDFGYPQLFIRSDGGIVCVYYWDRGNVDLPPSIECSHIYL